MSKTSIVLSYFITNIWKISMKFLTNERDDSSYLAVPKIAESKI